MRIDYTYADGIWYARLCIASCVTSWANIIIGKDFNSIAECSISKTILFSNDWKGAFIREEKE